MTTPIILDNRGDLMVFRSAADALSWIEPIDVENGEYVVFDAEGRLLSLAVENEIVRISEAEAEPAHSDELRSRLAKFLKIAGIAGVDPNASLSDLVSLAARFAYER